MTKDKAIAELVRIWHSPHLDLSLKAGLAEAIEALKEKNRSDSLVRDDAENCKESKSKLDLISRQAAIDALDKRFDDVPMELTTEILQLRRDLRELPSAQPEQRWIPCSERLPENIRPVIVTWKNTDPASYYQYIVGKHFTGTACYKNGKWYWYSSTTEDMLAEYGRYDSEEFDEAIECIAWMPLSEPYKGGEDE